MGVLAYAFPTLGDNIMIKECFQGINLKSLAITIVAVFVYIVASDFLIHGILLKDVYHDTANLWRMPSDPHFKYMHLGQLIIAIFFTKIFAVGYRGTGIKEGFRYGVMMGFYAIGGMIIQYAVMPFPCSVVCSWMGFGMVQLIGGGILCSLVYRK